jgi:hypothetical protein
MLNARAVLIALLTWTLCGCSMKVVPDLSGGGIASPDGKGMTVSRQSISVTVRHVEPEIITTVEGGIAAFNVEIANNGEAELQSDPDSFVLVGADQRQYFYLSPEKVRQLLAKDTYYLLPYPYVGFYYSEDYAEAEFRNSTNSSLPYYYEYRPQELFTSALQAGKIVPGAKTSGYVYFPADLYNMPAFRLMYYPPGATKSTPTDFVFPFKVTK